MRIPSVKNLTSHGFTVDQAQKIRERINRYYDVNSFGEKIPVNCLADVSDIIDGFGYESIPAGHNQRSPEIHYVNMGDTYATTILFIRGRFSVGCWGDIVERGNYD